MNQQFEVIKTLCLVSCLALSGFASAAEEPALWDVTVPVPTADQLAEIAGVEFYVIKKHEPQVDTFDWMHGVALAWHRDRWFVSYGHNHGKENTASEVANYSVSNDDGATWSAPLLMDSGENENLAVSHGVFLSHGKKLWAFHGAFSGRMQNIHTRAYTWDDTAKEWTKRGIVIENGFWPMQEPQRMADGNWMMAGLQVIGGIGSPNNPAAVAISHGDDLLNWDLVSIPKPADISMWGESAVLIDGPDIVNISRYRSPIALTANSHDYGRTWTTMNASNLPMTASKPYAGVLSTGQRYLIGNTAADNRNRRWPLTIAVTEPQGKQFCRTYRIRNATSDGPGESHASAALSYPYAVERNGKLYVGYSNNGGRGANRNSAELAIIPVASLASPPTSHAAKELLNSRVEHELSFSSFIGGSNWEHARDVFVDGAENVYVVGGTQTGDSPVSQNGMAVGKFSSAAGAFLGRTYVGGRAEEEPDGIDTDQAGNVFFTGKTSSADFPVTPDAVQFQRSGQYDATLVLLAADLFSMKYGSFPGGESYDHGRSSFFANRGNLFVAGSTNGPGWPTKNAHQPQFAGGGGGQELCCEGGCYAGDVILSRLARKNE